MSARLRRRGSNSLPAHSDPLYSGGMHPCSALSPIHPGRGRPVFRALLALLGSVLLLGGCGIAVDSGGGDTGSDSPIDSVNRDDLDSDERGAVDATTAFWRETFPADFRQSYRPPRVLGGYVGEDGPSCGGQQSVAFPAVLTAERRGPCDLVSR